MAVFEQVGVRAVVEGAQAYRRDADTVNRETAKIGRTSETTAKKTETLSTSLNRVGSRMQEVGRQAVILGTALAGPAVATGFLAARFDAEFVKIENLVGESRAVLQGMRGDVLDLARGTARGPQELAQALFVIESGGLRGAEALEVLEKAAGASALGLGNTGDIARLTTQALIAFRDQNLTASKAVEVLIGTARAGNFEVSQLAATFSRVLPLGAELGIQFSDLGAFVAAFTRVGGNAANATIALQATLIALTRGGTAAQEALASVGLTLEELRKTARERGLAQALSDILKAAEAGGEDSLAVLAEIIPNIRALRGVLATAGAQGDEFAAISRELASDTDLLGEGLERLADDSLFRINQAFAEVKVSAIEFGEAIAPVLGNLAQVLAKLATAFAALPGPVRSTLGITALLSGGLLIAAGSVGVLVGGILKIAPAAIGARSALIALRIATAGFGGPLALAVTGVIALGAAFVLPKLLGGGKEAAEVIDEVAEASDRLAEAVGRATEALEGQALDIEVSASFQNIAQIQAEIAKLDADLRTTPSEDVAAFDAIIAARRVLIDLLISETAEAEELSFALDLLNTSRNRSEESLRDERVELEALRDALLDTTDVEEEARREGQSAVVVQETAAAAAKARGPEVAALTAQIDLLTAAEGLARTAIESTTRALSEQSRELFASAVANAAELERIFAFAAEQGIQLRSINRRQQAEIIRGLDALGFALDDEAAGAADILRQIDELGGAFDDAATAATRLAAETRRAADAARAAQIAAAEQGRVDIRQRADQQIILLGDLLTGALRDQADDRLRNELEAIDDELRARRRAFDERIRQIEDARDAAIEALREETDAQTVALEAELEGIDTARFADELAELERRLALAFDPRERAAVEQEIEELRRRRREEQVRDEIRGIREASRDQEREIRERARTAIEIAQDELERELELLEQRTENAQAAFAQFTEAYRLEAEARRLIEQDEQEAIIALLDTFVPQWRSAGIDFATQLREGIRSVDLPGFLASILSELPPSGGGRSAAEEDRRARIASLNTIGETIKAEGAPPSILAALREDIADLGGLPTFQRGLAAGPIPGPSGQPVLITAHAGEVVLSRSDLRALSRPTFSDGAFRGMFDGATLTGTPEQNMRAVAREFEALMDDQLGRGAFIRGAGN